MMILTNRNLLIWLLTASLLALVATLLVIWSPAQAGEGAQQHAGAGVSAGAIQWGFIAAALATGLSSLGAGIAVASVGSAAIGALAEKPELLGRALIMVGLAEGIAIYGLIISILILNKVI
jgi:V/A-type H+/Na+-transporting ATPase subunit K